MCVDQLLWNYLFGVQGLRFKVLVFTV